MIVEQISRVNFGVKFIVLHKMCISDEIKIHSLARIKFRVQIQGNTNLLNIESVFLVKFRVCTKG